MPIADPPRRAGLDPADVTSFKAGQWNWSLDNLPNVSRPISPLHGDEKGRIFQSLLLTTVWGE